MISFDTFIQEWLGKRVDYDHIYGFQCVDLIRQYFYECYGLSGGGGVPTAIAYWTNTPADVLTKFSKDGSGSVQKGDVVMLRTLGHSDYAGDGHIGIATGNGDPNSIEILEQNGLGSGTGLGGDAIRTRFVPRNRLAGVLRPIPVIPTFDANRYKVPYPAPKQVRLNKLANKWDYNYPDFNSIAAHSVGTEPQGYIFTAVGFLSHPCGETYYLESMGDPNGWNIKDADDYTPPPPAPQVINTPTPVINRAETYTVITKLMVFPSATDAKALSNYTGSDLEPGVYYVFAKDNNAFNLSTSNVQNQNKWVRITDNVIKPVVEAVAEVVQPTLPTDPMPPHNEPVDPPAPAPIEDIKPQAPKPQYNWIRDDRLPVKLTSTNSTPVPIYDLEGKWPKQQFPAHRTEEYSMFTVVDNVEYWIPDRCRNGGYMYGVPLQFLPDEEPIKPTLLDRNGNGKYDIIDIFDTSLGNFIDFSSKYLDGIKAAVTTVAPKIEPAKQRIQQSIDGFSAKRKK